EVEGGAVAALDHLHHRQLGLALVRDRAGLVVAGGEAAGAVGAERGLPHGRADGVAVAERLGDAVGGADVVAVGGLAAAAGDVVEHVGAVDGEVEGGAVAALDHLHHRQLRLALVRDRAGLVVAGGEAAGAVGPERGLPHRPADGAPVAHGLGDRVVGADVVGGVGLAAAAGGVFV